MDQGLKLRLWVNFNGGGGGAPQTRLLSSGCTYLTDGVSTAEADGAVVGLTEDVVADGARQELGPLRRLPLHRRLKRELTGLIRACVHTIHMAELVTIMKP